MSVKVVGLGMPRTGTSSLKAALESIGFGPCLHMDNLFNTPPLVKSWHQFLEKGEGDFGRLFPDFQSSTDFPGCLMYREIYQQYPDAKFILGTRDADAWYDSVERTIYSVVPNTEEGWAGIRKRGEDNPRFENIGNALHLVGEYLLNRYFQGDFLNRELTIKRYNQFYEEVSAFIPADQLLKYEISQGWDPICQFLGVDVPEAEFPYKNKTIDFQQQIGKMINGGGKLTLK